MDKRKILQKPENIPEGFLWCNDILHRGDNPFIGNLDDHFYKGRAQCKKCFNRMNREKKILNPQSPLSPICNQETFDKLKKYDKIFLAKISDLLVNVKVGTNPNFFSVDKPITFRPIINKKYDKRINQLEITIELLILDFIEIVQKLKEKLKNKIN